MAKVALGRFIELVQRSGLVEPARFSQCLSEWQQATAPSTPPDAAAPQPAGPAASPDTGAAAAAGAASPSVDTAVAEPDAESLADYLVAKKVLTRWQCGMLLRGRYKGFFLGKYMLLDHLGSGGMSCVYLAEHMRIRQLRAVKVLPPSRVHDASYLERFRLEAMAAASVRHPNLVQAFDADNDGNNHYLVMEYVEGIDLQQMVKKMGVLGFEVAAEYARQAAIGLAHAHSKGLIHRDIKPANLLVDLEGTVKVLDMGLARFTDDRDGAFILSHDEGVLGTADYLAPEQAVNSREVDARADIYSLGCTLYFMLTGQPPFPDGSLSQRLHKHQHDEPPGILQFRPDAPPDLVAIIERMMCKSLDRRVPSANEVADLLAAWLAGRSGEATRRSMLVPTDPGLSGPGSSPSRPGSHGGSSVVSGREAAVGSSQVIAGLGGAGLARSAAHTDTARNLDPTFKGPRVVVPPPPTVVAADRHAEISGELIGDSNVLAKAAAPPAEPQKPKARRLPVAKPLDPVLDVALRSKPAQPKGTAASSPATEAPSPRLEPKKPAAASAPAAVAPPKTEPPAASVKQAEPPLPQDPAATAAAPFPDIEASARGGPARPGARNWGIVFFVVAMLAAAAAVVLKLTGVLP